MEPCPSPSHHSHPLVHQIRCPPTQEDLGYQGFCLGRRFRILGNLQSTERARITRNERPAAKPKASQSPSRHRTSPCRDVLHASHGPPKRNQIYPLQLWSGRRVWSLEPPAEFERWRPSSYAGGVLVDLFGKHVNICQCSVLLSSYEKEAQEPGTLLQ